ncbi:BamA/TamA family outer membrane protein [Xanthomarina sp. F2636L]|uniref:translocation and assembly module lipoprotein TamL n=1 Tax=Xanthomarina sp. F2636L TaxID=2996018 RepID=UPI00225DF93E|nr:BamA/TamA family outer membrane protein [Xanthomarina sp. F2636L]MCX7550826.1 BamA/TamA family outer membrane protein [Xanthomarina sp. F2636L]
MKLQFSKIVLFIVITGFLYSCNSVKRVPENEHLLVENNIYVNDKKNNTERVNNLLFQQRNKKIVNIPLRLHIYNTARPNIDSIINANIDSKPKKRKRLERFLSKKQLDKYIETRVGINNWLKNTGETPVIVNKEKTERSEKQLEAYYFNNGWFNVDATSKTDTLENKKATINYYVKTGDPYIVDSLSTKIASPIVDSLYNVTKKESFIKKNQQYRTATFANEKERIIREMRNSGVYHFNQDYVYFDMDTINTNKKVHVELQILNRSIRSQDSTFKKPFSIYKIKEVNVFTDFSYEKKDLELSDSTKFKNFNLYSFGKMRFKPKAITDAIFITPGDVFRDKDRTNTYRHINNLQTFKHPSIDYIENPDSTLTANILLTPYKKFGLNFSAEVSQSNIQSIGLAFNPSLLMRNVFRGSETLELSAFGSIGASKDGGDESDPFFDINEIGVDLRLTIPRLFFPFNTEKIIPKTMFPSTRISISSSSQTNVGLDKQTVSSIFNYKWFASNLVTNRLDLFNIQYVRNLNTDNYFGIYGNSYNELNNISQDIDYNNGNDLNFPSQTDAFINDVLSGNTSLQPGDPDYDDVYAINERKIRLTENNLIFATNFNYTRDNRENLYDETFSIFRFKVELAGNLFSAISKIASLDKNNTNQYEIFNVAYSQYVKTEFDYIKHWDLGKKNVLAIRTFAGIAIPYGNSTNIPFSKSFFAGGTNDNRAWTAYSLGPGSLDSNDEFNEANLKLAFNIEHRFNIFESFNGALFIDTGNIWNVFDDVTDPKATFTNFASLKDIAVGSGFGLRYDFGFAVFRFDIGFKTYDPSRQENNRWFKDYNFSNAVYNIGINYPF